MPKMSHENSIWFQYDFMNHPNFLCKYTVKFRSECKVANLFFYIIPSYFWAFKDIGVKMNGEI